MNNETGWIETAKQRPTAADFVPGEWAVEFFCPDGSRGFYDKYLGPIVGSRSTHWRKVWLAPPPVAKLATAEQRDEAAWEKWKNVYATCCSEQEKAVGHTAVVDCLRWQREEIKELVRIASGEGSEWDGHEEWATIRLSMWQLIRAAVGLEN